jgi:hypothetical protein
VLGHTRSPDANFVSIMSHERPHLSLPYKPLLGGCWICYDLSVQVFKKFQMQATRVLGFFKTSETKVIPGSRYLKKIQRTGCFPQRTN